MGTTTTPVPCAEPKCCCGCCPVRTGAWLIGIIEILLSIAGLVASIIAISFSPPVGDKTEYLANSVQPFHYALLALCFLLLFTASLAIYGSLSSSRGLLLPHMLALIPACGFLGIRLLFVCLSLSYRSINMGVGIFAAIFIGCMLLLHVYFFAVYWSTYRWFGRLIRLKKRTQHHVENNANIDHRHNYNRNAGAAAVYYDRQQVRGQYVR